MGAKEIIRGQKVELAFIADEKRNKEQKNYRWFTEWMLFGCVVLLLLLIICNRQ